MSHHAPARLTPAVLALCGLVLWSGCTSAGPPHARRGAGDEIGGTVRIFDQGAPECPYDTVGQVSTEVEGSPAEFNFGARQRYLVRLQREAQRHACDAVVDVQAADAGGGRCLVSGTMIRFRRADCRR